MRLLFLGDILGRSGRDAVIREMPRLKRELATDFVVVNGENAAAGFGITNFPAGTPGKGLRTFQLTDGRRIVVINVMCRLFMDPLDDPFACLDRELAGRQLGGNVAAVLVDVHGEATSEKMAIGHYLDGRASLVVGTHSHIPTADAQILTKGTAYLTDAGMCGDYDSVIGMQKEAAIHRFVRKTPGERLTPAEGEATVCGVFVETDDATGLAKRIAPIRVGGRLQPAWI